MSGSMRERRPGTWELKVSLGRDERGVPRAATRTFRGGVRAARKALDALVTEVAEGRVEGPNRSTVDGLCWQYLEDRERTLSPATISIYREAAKLVRRTSLGAKRLDRVTALDVDAAYGELRDAGVGPFRLAQVHRFLRSAWRQGIRWQLVRTNPVSDAQPPRTPRRPVVAPTPGAVLAVLDEVRRGDPDAAAVLFLGALTGLRRGALCGLQWGDLDGGRLVVRRSIVLVDGTPVERPPKMRADGEVEAVVLGAPERIALAGLLEAVEARRTAAGLAPVGPGHWILSDDGLGTSPVDPAMLNRRMRDACRRLGLARMSPHDLRHFAATQMVAAGVPIDAVARRLHHRNASVTLAVYAHPTEADELAAAGAVARALRA